MNKKMNLNPNVKYNEITKKVYIDCIDDYGNDKTITVDVEINDFAKTVRIKEIPDNIRYYLLSQIVFAVIEKCVLTPTNKYSIEKLTGDVGNYTLLVDNVLLNGLEKKRGSKCPSIITDFIENIPESPLEPMEMTVYRQKVKKVYEDLDKIKKNQNMEIVFSGKDRRLKAENTAIILKQYLKDKGYTVHYNQENNFTNTRICLFVSR